MGHGERRGENCLLQQASRFTKTGIARWAKRSHGWLKGERKSKQGNRKRGAKLWLMVGQFWSFFFEGKTNKKDKKKKKTPGEIPARAPQLISHQGSL